jgi:hypothetical protein
MNLVWHGRDLHHIATPVSVHAIEPHDDRLFGAHLKINIAVRTKVFGVDHRAAPDAVLGHDGDVLAPDTHGVGIEGLGQIARNEVHLR